MIRIGLARPREPWRASRLCVLAAAFVALASAPRLATADELASQQAETLFERGRELMEAGQLEEACALLAESQHLDPGGGTLLNLAVCHERQGRLATAWAEYHDARSEAVRQGREDRIALAGDRNKALKSRLPHLVVKLPATLPEGAEVRVDGAVLSRLAAGAPLPVDPGSHDVSATAPGRAPWSTHSASISEGQSVEVIVPELASILPAPPLGAPPGRSGPPLLTYASGGVALAGYATVAITGAMALSAQGTVNSSCNAALRFCTDQNAATDASRARTLGWVSTISLVVAVAATGVAIATAIWPRKQRIQTRIGTLEVSVEGFGASF